MLDILLSTLTHDIVFDDGGELQSVEGAAMVAQKVWIRLDTQLGEWLYDLAMGIDYLGVVLVKAPDSRVTRSQFVVQINAVDEVTAIRSLTLTTTQPGRKLDVAFVAETTEGAISGVA